MPLKKVAWTILTKPFQQEEVLARVATHIELYRLHCQLEKLLTQQSKMAATDQLTGIYNRYKFELLFTQELEQVKRYNTPLSLIMFDIDNFKNINDTYGHISGDHILQQITSIVKNLIRKTEW